MLQNAYLRWRKQPLGAFVLGAVFGALIWLVLPLITGRREAWDGGIGIFIAALALAGFFAGAVTAGRFWVSVIGIYCGQLVFMILQPFVKPNEAGDERAAIWMGATVLAVFTLIALAAAALAAGIRWLVCRRSKLLAAAVLVLLIGWPEPSRAAQEAPKLNVIVILTDDLGYGDLGCYGHPMRATPNLDRMAAEGVRFTDFYAPYPACAPTRAALLTGRYPFRLPVMYNPTLDSSSGGIGSVDGGMPDEELTLAEAFKGAGYATGCIGKWHLGWKPQYFPLEHGFDEYYGLLYSNSERPTLLWDGPKVVEEPVVQATLTQRYTQRALRFIETNRDRPFFLYLAHAMPHYPLAASEPFRDRAPAGGGLFGDVVAELDWSTGQVLEKLKSLGIAGRTLVIFTSDNGPWFGGSTGGLRGMKGGTWEGGVRVPMIAWGPGIILAGRTCRQPAGIIDLFPTLSALCGIEPPLERSIDGRDIRPLLTDSDARSPHEALFFMVGTRLMGLRSGRWKLHVRDPGPGAPGAPGAPGGGQPSPQWWQRVAPDGVTLLAPDEQYTQKAHPGITSGDPPRAGMLFDLEADPAEQHDVAAQHPQVVRRLTRIFERMNEQFPEITPPR